MFSSFCVIASGPNLCGHPVELVIFQPRNNTIAETAIYTAHWGKKRNFPEFFNFSKGPNFGSFAKKLPKIKYFKECKFLEKLIFCHSVSKIEIAEGFSLQKLKIILDRNSQSNAIILK